MIFSFFEKLLDPYPDLSRGRTLSQAPRPRFLAFMRFSLHGLGWQYGVLVVLSAAIAVLEALLFGFLGRIIDWLSGMQAGSMWQQASGQLAGMALVLLSLVAFTSLQTLFKNQVLSNNFPMRLRWIYHHLMLNQSMAFFHNEFSGSVTHKVIQTVMAVRQLLSVLCGMVVFVVVYFITLFSVISSFHPLLLVPLCIWLLCYAAILLAYVPSLGQISQDQAAARALMSGRISDVYANIGTIKLFAHTKHESAYVKDAMKEYMVSAHQMARRVANIDIYNEILNIAVIAGTLALALWLWNQGHITTGAVAAAASMTIRLKSMAYSMMWDMASLFENVGVVRDGMRTFARSNLVLDAPDAAPLQVSKGEVVFDHITFAYENPGKTAGATGAVHAPAPVIDDLSLSLRPGEKIGLLGPSGAGKSTLLSLLLRFYDVQGGSIRIDGQDIRHVTQESLRRAIGVVTQDTSLLYRSIRDNILYGRPDATEEEIIAAAKQAQAHDFIERLRDRNNRRGYDALVGERGVKLSGGQRQRIAIARVMLKNAPILLLDEATSALDSEVEAAIQESLYRLMDGKTVIAIAHRLSTIAAMDRLVVLDKGRIVEQGSHQQLLASGGLYAKLWARQSGGFLGRP